MKNQKIRWGCLISAMLILTLLVLSGGWWYFRSQYRTKVISPDSPVLVFLLSPSGGTEVNAGDFMTVTAQAVAPEPIARVELYVDGQLEGMVTDSPENASWTWQAKSVGIHALFVRAAAEDGRIGQSQTAIVNVLAGDGMMDIPAEEGQTLEQIGAYFGIPPDQMAGANPNVNPTQPLKDGQPVQVPVSEGNAGGGGAGDGSGQGGAGAQPFPLILISWQFKPTEPVDKSYCYTSDGGGAWEKMPKETFEFFGSTQADYLQTDFPFNKNKIVIQMQCWGWLGDALKYLGEGETQFETLQQPNQVMISGAGFEFVGIPQYPAETGGPTLSVPPPFAMREPLDTADCTQHYGNLLAGFVCDSLLNAKVKQYYVLEWEWEPRVNWPGNETWLNDIGGYRIYEIDPLTKSPSFLKEIGDPNQKVTAVPLPWGARCYGVQAFPNDPIIESSEITTYCPGEPPTSQKITLTPLNWLTTGGTWVESGDCDTYGGADSYLLENKNSGFGNNPGEILVGGYLVDDDDDDCFKQGDYSGGVKFPHPTLLANAVVQKAVLKFSQVFTDYRASGVATNYKLFCVGGVGKAKQDWTGLDTGNHFAGSHVLSSKLYNSPMASLSGWDSTPEVDVTSAVNNWIKHPDQNHGFILTPLGVPKPAVDGSGICESGAGNFQLEIYYFAP
jgi:hypothetical protein